MIRRPLVRYHGGKWKLAPWIVSNLPRHRIYVEPFGGGGSVLLRKPRCHAEVYNDKDGEVVNLFRVVRDQGEELRRVVSLTPFSRVEYEASYKPADDAIEQARRTVIRAFMGFGSASINGQASGFRANSNRSHGTPAHDWRNWPDCVREITERLRAVVIENREAVDVMDAHDGDETLHYLDPPYVHSTRNVRERSLAYRFEMSDDDHVALAVAAKRMRGLVVVSGYRCDLYDSLFGGWQRIDKRTMADGAKPRIESLWLSPNCPAQGLFPSQDAVA